MNTDLRVTIMLALCVKTAQEEESRLRQRECSICEGKFSDVVYRMRNCKRLFKQRIALGEDFDEDLWEQFLELYKYLKNKDCQ